MKLTFSCSTNTY